eukprot:CAMPEP_0119319430 /NCGR_PEP_ID=MMETSP1333-20130426/49335_1 /TAXON_ID=418940 /ORGANISM="Scyphosphaera apsteinii, Strain RCC1455" /LENGTH=421 /DNA_ID=CAMNT_0007325835 /DNA_START=51 /DNA_END=1316 /DNA_ORIENTATION=+
MGQFQEFHLSYEYDSSGGAMYGLVENGVSRRPIAGFEPLGTQQLPIFVFIMGTGDNFLSPVDVELLWGMAQRGFISATVDYPNPYSELQTSNPDNDDWFLWKAGRIFPAALDVLCALPRADCSLGVAVAGHSQGGYITLGSVYQDERISAILPMGILSFTRLASENRNFTAWMEDDLLSTTVPKHKRRIVLGLNDEVLFPDYLPVPQYILKGFAYVALKYMSGYYDCMEGQNNCLQPDGSGFLLIEGGMHNFYGNCDPGILLPAGIIAGGELDLTEASGTITKCGFRDGTGEDGMGKNFDWLARAATGTEAVVANVPFPRSCTPRPEYDTLVNDVTHLYGSDLASCAAGLFPHSAAGWTSGYIPCAVDGACREHLGAPLFLPKESLKYCSPGCFFTSRRLLFSSFDPTEEVTPGGEKCVCN